LKFCLLGIWPLKIDNQYDNHLVVAFFDQTRYFFLSLLCNLSFCIRLFHLQNDEIEEVELSGFDYQHQTLFSTNVISNQYLQVKNIQFHIRKTKLYAIR